MQKRTFSQILELVEMSSFFVVDQVLIDLYPKLEEKLGNSSVFFVDKPEKSKSFDTYQSACEFFLNQGITRNDSLIAIGGGATSDLAGFVASSLLRGIPWKVIPTTLLAMIDASIGGKTGINTGAGKNLVGSFHLPAEIFLCQDFLNTLPEEELKSGKGELFKYLILSREIADTYSGEITGEVILKCAEYKNQLVTEDPFEKGVRRLLNLGHTFGHGIEKSSNIPHGQAVAIGIYWMVLLYRPQIKEELMDLALKLDLELNLATQLDLNTFKNFVMKDKKRISKTELEIIVPANVGVSEIKPLSFETLFKDLSESEVSENFK